MLTGGVDNVEVFMKVEWKQLKGPRYIIINRVSDVSVCIRYYKMDLTQSLRENLSYKTVIEHPTLHVCMGQSSSIGRYVIYDRSVDYGMI